jgi:putative acetyltransferase
LIIRFEGEADTGAISDLAAEAFGSRTEARLIERLRDEGHIVVSLVAVEDGKVVGNVVFSHLSIVTDSSTIEAAALAPIAVSRDYQGVGIGTALILEGLRVCKAHGKDVVLVLGDPRYYVRFGFSAERATAIASKYSGPSFMATELTPGVLNNVSGSVTYPSAFDEVE